MAVVRALGDHRWFSQTIRRATVWWSQWALVLPSKDAGSPGLSFFCLNHPAHYQSPISASFPSSFSPASPSSVPVITAISVGLTRVPGPPSDLPGHTRCQPESLSLHSLCPLPPSLSPPTTPNFSPLASTSLAGLHAPLSPSLFVWEELVGG